MKSSLMTKQLTGTIKQCEGNMYSLTAFRGQYFSFSYVYPTIEKAQEAAKKYKVMVGQ